METGDGTTPYIGTKLHCKPGECLGLMLLMYNKERSAGAADIMGCPPRQVPEEACKLLYTTQQTDGRWDCNVTGYHTANLRALLVVKAHLVPAGTVPRGCWFLKKESKELMAALKQLRLLQAITTATACCDKIGLQLAAPCPVWRSCFGN